MRMIEIFKYKRFFNWTGEVKLGRFEIPEALYPDKKLAAAWINLQSGLALKPSELHWKCPTWATPTWNPGTGL